MVVVRSEIDYVGQMNLRAEPYDVWCRVAEVGSTSLTFESEIRDGDRPMARSRVVEVNIGEEGRPAPMRPEHREIFEQRMREAQAE
jgi:acyl-CoA thioesterase FadM